jgi:pilus assembly protein CpaE
VSGITVLSANSALEKTLVGLYGRSMAVTRAWSDRWQDPGQVAAAACADDPDLVVIGSDIRQDQVVAIVEELHRGFPATAVVCLVVGRDVEYSMRLLRIGARDVIIDQATPEELQTEIDPVVRIVRSRSTPDSDGDGQGRTRRVITVISPKGGTGKTTVSTNVATALAKRQPSEVVLLDLDTQFGDCAPALGLTPEQNLVDAIDGLSDRPSTLKAFLTDHSSGLLVLSPPDDLVVVEQIEPEQLEQVLVVAAKEFPLVVVDTASGIDAASLAGIEVATDLLLVTTPDAPSVRATRRQLDTLDQLGYTAQRRILVLNRSTARGGLSVGEVESALGLTVAFQIPNTRLVTQSTNAGIPVVERNASSGAGKGFDQLARHLGPGDGDGRKGRLRGRRASR